MDALSGASAASAVVDDRRERRSTRPSNSAFPAAVLVLLFAGGLVEMALLAAWQRNGYWNFSDGVYAQSARELIHGVAPYDGFAAAQPPPVYLVGAVLLVVHDGLVSLRVGMGLLDLLTAVLVGACVWRLSGRRWLAVVAAGVSPLLPISLHEHAQLTPETLAAPLLMLGALCCAEQRRASIGGVLLVLAAACKVAFLVPAFSIVLAARARMRTACALAAAGAILGGISLAVFGVEIWREVVEAQLQVGTASTRYAGGLLAQAAWNELPLLVGASAAVWLLWSGGAHTREMALVGTLVACSVGGLLLLLTVFKRGSYINVLVVCEPALLALAACGASWSWVRWPYLGRRSLVVVLATLLAAQSLSLLIRPSDPWLAKRPGARSGLTWIASPTAADRAVAVARRCPRTRAYSGVPYLAFLASRRMPGDQPDLFMIDRAPIDASFLARAEQDTSRCPP